MAAYLINSARLDGLLLPQTLRVEVWQPTAERQLDLEELMLAISSFLQPLGVPSEGRHPLESTALDCPQNPHQVFLKRSISQESGKSAGGNEMSPISSSLFS